MKLWDDISKKQRIERWQQVLRVLRALTPHQRRKHWDMGDFGYKTECGTIACAAGHCGLDPWFHRHDFKMEWKACNCGIKDCGSYDIPVVSEFFGHEGSDKIFYNALSRPVGKVIREVRAYIKELEQE